MLGSLALEAIEKQRKKLENLSYKIWENPEGPYEERKACKWSAQILEESGFDVEIGVAGIPTAVKASWGSGHPVIGFLGEYDALPDLSQKVTTEEDPIKAGEYGHGCGHNLLGVACIGAVIGMKEEMTKSNLKGTIIYYGCPAEEVLTGKAFMVRGGAFDCLDMCIAYHPGRVNSIGFTGICSISSKFHFKGIKAHASGDPYNGRSALDAVELTNVGANYLREHVKTDVRIHYATIDGGKVPNIVPDKACVWYYVRAPKPDMVKEVYSRLLDVARGAALMTGTTFIEESLGGCYNALNNEFLGKIMYDTLAEIPQEELTPEETSFAAKLNDNDKVQTQANRKEYNMPDDRAVFTGILPMQQSSGYGSSDIGDVQHIVPGVFLRTVCCNIGATGHSWQITACSGHSIGQKGMIRASKVMALFGLKVLSEPSIYIEAKKEFDSEIADEKYICMLPENATIPN